MTAFETYCPSFVGKGWIRYYSLARHALIDALRMAGVGRGSRVLLPEYLCRDVLAPLTLLGALPRWYEVGPELAPSTIAADWPKADVVLAVNYFGFPQDLQPFFDYAKRTGAVVIEDNAHGYLSRDQNGQWLGCRTSFGVFSLRKTLRIPDGAALWVSACNGEFELPTQCAFDGAGYNLAQLTKARLRRVPAVGEFAYRSTTKLARMLRRWRSGSYIPASDPNSERALPIAANPWAGLLSALTSCDEMAEIQRRRAAYARCAEIGERLGAVPVFSGLPSYTTPYAYAFRGDAVVQAGMHRHAARHGFDLVSWPDLPTEIVGNAPAHYRNVFLVNLLW